MKVNTGGFQTTKLVLVKLYETLLHDRIVHHFESGNSGVEGGNTTQFHDKIMEIFLESSSIQCI